MNDGATTERKLTVVVNGEAVVEYDRGVTLPPRQRDYLDAMDRRMAAGIRLGDERVATPDQLQRAQFVALQLWRALEENDDAPIAASCAWLASRIPELRQVKIEAGGEGAHIDLVFDRDYVKEVRVDFVMPDKPGKGGPH